MINHLSSVLCPFASFNSRHRSRSDIRLRSLFLTGRFLSPPSHFLFSSLTSPTMSFLFSMLVLLWHWKYLASFFFLSSCLLALVLGIWPNTACWSDLPCHHWLVAGLNPLHYKPLSLQHKYSVDWLCFAVLWLTLALGRYLMMFFVVRGVKLNLALIANQ